jgi:hypothetical protein
MSRYRLFGVNLDTDLDLPNARPVDEPADLVLRSRGQRKVPLGAAEGRRIAEHLLGDIVAFSAAARGEEVLLRMAGVAEFTIAADFGSIDYVRDPAADEAMVPMLFSGLVMATYLQLQGELVLHATAVQVPSLGGAVALVGSSGMGKSTVATLMATEGAQLIADDVLRVDDVDGRLMCRLGSTEARLRPKAFTLAQATAAAARPTVDGRLAVSLPVAEQDAPLLAMVIPGPVEGEPQVWLNRLDPVPAMMEVLRHPRVPGWVDQPSTANQFRRITDLVKRVPLFTSRLPWGPPYPATLGADLLSALESELSG